MNNYRTDLTIDKNKTFKKIKTYKNIEVLENKNNALLYHTIKFSSVEIKNELINILKKELLSFIKSFNIKIKHILIVGLGNESNTADSIGPKTIKKINVNFNIDNINNNNIIKVSALIPGVLGITGIETNKIIKSVIKEINPDLIILVDSIVTNNIEFINKTIEISNNSLTPGSGIYGNNKELKTKKPIISIGIPTSLEYIHNGIPFLLTPSNIDYYILKISTIISEAINSLVYKDLIETPV